MNQAPYIDCCGSWLGAAVLDVRIAFVGVLECQHVFFQAPYVLDTVLVLLRWCTELHRTVPTGHKVALRSLSIGNDAESLLSSPNPLTQVQATYLFRSKLVTCFSTDMI